MYKAYTKESDDDDGCQVITVAHMAFNIDHMTAVSSLMDRLLDLSKNSIQYGNSMYPSMIRKLKVIVYFRKVFHLSKFKYFCFVTPFFGLKSLCKNV
jgi:hypothetical protein